MLKESGLPKVGVFVVLGLLLFSGINLASESLTGESLFGMPTGALFHDGGDLDLPNTGTSAKDIKVPPETTEEEPTEEPTGDEPADEVTTQDTTDDNTGTTAGRTKTTTSTQDTSRSRLGSLFERRVTRPGTTPKGAEVTSIRDNRFQIDRGFAGGRSGSKKTEGRAPKKKSHDIGDIPGLKSQVLGASLSPLGIYTTEGNSCDQVCSKASRMPVVEYECSTAHQVDGEATSCQTQTGIRTCSCVSTDLEIGNLVPEEVRTQSQKIT